MSGVDNPGVRSVRAIYEYYKHFGIATEVMGPAFATPARLWPWRGVILLTIAPELLVSSARARRLLHQVLRAAPLCSSQLQAVPTTKQAFALR